MHPVHEATNWTLADLSEGSPHQPMIKDWPFMQYIFGIIYMLIIVVSLAGNLLVVLAVLTDKRLQNVTHFLLMSLAFADLTVTTLVMPFALHYDVGGSWEYGKSFCYFWMSVDVMCCTASLQHLCGVAWDRYVAISYPFDYPSRMSPIKATLLIIGIWINSALISFLPIFMGWFSNDRFYSVPEHQCFLETNPIYAIISASVSFYLPLCGMIFCYVKIFRIAWEKHRTFERQQQSLQGALNNSVADATQKQQPQSHASHWKAVKTLGVIFGLFVLCWLPFFIIYWIDSFAEPGFVPQPLHSVITWLGYLNSTMNPIIYSRNEDFRAAYCKLFRTIYYLGRKSKSGLKGMRANGEKDYSATFTSFSTNNVELTEEDIFELEKIFWPVSKPLFNPVAEIQPQFKKRSSLRSSRKSFKRETDGAEEKLIKSETEVIIEGAPIE